VDWKELFSMQKQLDQYIIDNHQLHNKTLLQEKCLAILVELGELANETRCFKFWSTKDASDRETTLEEYVDSIHFILSIGLELGYSYEQEVLPVSEKTKTEQFNDVFSQMTHFMQNQSEQNYQKVFQALLQLGHLLGFSESDIQEAYYEKNKVNFARQNEGY